MKHTEMDQMSQEMVRCIEECQACHNFCLESVQHCLKMGGKTCGAPSYPAAFGLC
jgi:hypothetical protein